MKATLKDIAQALSLSPATVSRILNHKSNFMVSEETRRKTFETAEKLGYKPNSLARALHTGRTDVIGLVLVEADLLDPILAEICRMLEMTIRSLGYKLMLIGNPEVVQSEICADGLIAFDNPQSELFEKLKRTAPSISISSSPKPIANCVGWSPVEGIGKANDYLIGLGHKSILYLLSDDSVENNLIMTGTEQKAKDYPLNITFQIGSYTADGLQNGALLTKDALDKGIPFTAVVGCNDLLSLGAMKTLKELQVRLSREISVVSYGDLHRQANAYAGLTAVQIPVAQAVKSSVALLLKMISAGTLDCEGYLLPSRLIERASALPAP